MRISLRHQQEHLTFDLQPEGTAYRVAAGDSEFRVEAHYLDDHTLMLTVDGRPHRVHMTRNGRERQVAIAGEVYAFSPESADAAHSVASLATPEITAPMPGKVLQVLVKTGDHVAAGDGLLILEAMKMENRLTAEAPATVREVHVAEGQMVDGGQVLVTLDYDAT